MSGARSLGQVIRQRRLELGWSQEELAERISGDGEYVRQSEISRLERGVVGLPRRARLERVAAAIGMPLGELLARSGWSGAERAFDADADAMAAPPTLDEVPPINVLDAGASEHEDDLIEWWGASPTPRSGVATARLRSAVAQAHELRDKTSALLAEAEKTRVRWDEVADRRRRTS